jgi:hypothetical protein
LANENVKAVAEPTDSWRSGCMRVLVRGTIGTETGQVLASDFER